MNGKDFISIEEMGKFMKFKNFFKRYNSVLLGTTALKKEKENELKKNQNLKTQLLKYMDGMTITKYALNDETNTLLNTKSK